MAQVKGDDARPVSPACDPKSRAGRLCVCETCNCGMHKCPAKHTSVHAHYDPKTVSEYTAKYPEWPMPKKFVRKQVPNIENNARLDCHTTYTNDFVKHPWGPRENMQPKPKNEFTGRSQKETTYNVDFWDKSKTMAPKKKMPHQIHNPGGKFSGDTTYTVDFANHGPQNPNVVINHGCSLGKTGAKFVGDTTYHDNFRKWAMPKMYLHKKGDRPQLTQKFSGPTTYQADFQGLKIPGKCPVMTRGKPTIACGDHMCY